MPFAGGVNCRETAPFVTDGTNQTYDIDAGGAVAESYPTTRGGLTFGWDSTTVGNLRDRNSGNDPRVAGTQWSGTGGEKLRLDLGSAGLTGDVRIAVGDPGGGATNIGNKIYDNATLLATIPNASISSGEFVDATGVTRTSASDWVTNNAPLNATFSSAILFVSIEQAVGGMCHISFTETAGGGGAAAQNLLTLLGVGV
jgi:hypothetical protein